jgi:hypothetical protein
MSGAIPPLPQYAFMAWCLVKHRDNFFYSRDWRHCDKGRFPFTPGSSVMAALSWERERDTRPWRKSRYWSAVNVVTAMFVKASRCTRRRVASWYLHSSVVHLLHRSKMERKAVSYEFCYIESVSKSFRTGRLERELRMVQLSASKCSFIAILWVSLVSFAAITLCVASQRVFIVYFVIDSVRKLLDTPSYSGRLKLVLVHHISCSPGYTVHGVSVQMAPVLFPKYLVSIMTTTHMKAGEGTTFETSCISNISQTIVNV